MSFNPKTVSWVNSTQGTDQNGNTVPWDATTDLAAISIEIDSEPVVSVPVSLGATSFDLTTLASYQALASGAHILALAVVTKEGAVSAFAAPDSFSTGVVPLAPTAVVVA